MARASINHNNIEGARVGLYLIATDSGRLVWRTDSDEDCGLGEFASEAEADEAAIAAWGADAWDLQWSAQ